MAAQQPPAGIATLEQLETTLEAALGLVVDLANDDLLRRLISVFANMPTQDRQVIIGVLEREVAGRLLSRATEGPIGQSTHPNPHARLYVRVHDSGFQRQIYDRDEMMIADIRGLRIGCLIRNVPGIYALWKDAMREAMTHVDEPTRGIAEELVHDILDCITQARATAKDEEATEAPPDTPKRTSGG
jgi:hypothetical protein